MPRLVEDITSAFTRLLRDRRNSLLVVFVLVTGLTPNILLWSLAHTVYVAPIPLPRADDLAIVRITTPKGAAAPITLEQMEAWAADTGLFTSVSAFRVDPGGILTGAGGPQALQVVAVTGRFLETLMMRPALGAGFTLDPRGRVRHEEILISHGLWRRVFHADPAVIGRPVVLGGRQRVITGVMPEGFDFPRVLYPQWETVDVWMPMREAADASVPSLIVRLNADVSAARERIASRLTPKQIESGHKVAVSTLREEVVADTAEPLGLLLTGAVCLMLLASLNVGHILLARAEARRRTASIKLALGASAARLIREQLAECLLLATAGGLVSLLAVWWSFQIIPSILPVSLGYLRAAQFSTVTLASALAGVALVTVACGILPALTAHSTSVAATLNESSAGAGLSRRRRRLQRVLVSSEVAFATLLTVSAAAAGDAFWRLTSVPRGFDDDRTLTVRLSLPRTTYQEPQKILGFYDTVLETLSAQSGMEGAALSTGVPGVAADGGSIVDPRGRQLDIRLQAVSGAYFRTLAIPLHAGRSFDRADGLDAQPVAIVDSRLAAWLQPDALGSSVRMEQEPTPRRIVGVVGTVHLFGNASDDRPHVYVPIHQVGLPSFTVLARHRSGENVARDLVARAVHAADPNQPLGRVISMSEQIRVQSATERFNLAVLASLGAVGLIIAVSGLYGLVSFITSVQARDMAVRLSLGASPETIRNLVIRDGLRLAGAGAVAGITAAILVNATMGLAPVSSLIARPFAVGMAFAVVVACTFLATLVPAARASRVEPSLSLRVP